MTVALGLFKPWSLHVAVLIYSLLVLILIMLQQDPAASFLPTMLKLTKIICENNSPD